MEKEQHLELRKRIRSYVISMELFKKLYLEGGLSEEMYELIEVRLANKYMLSRRSVFRMPYLLSATQGCLKNDKIKL